MLCDFWPTFQKVGFFDTAGRSWYKVVHFRLQPLVAFHTFHLISNRQKWQWMDCDLISQQKMLECRRTCAMRLCAVQVLNLILCHYFTTTVLFAWWMCAMSNDRLCRWHRRNCNGLSPFVFLQKLTVVQEAMQSALSDSLVLTVEVALWSEMGHCGVTDTSWLARKGSDRL